MVTSSYGEISLVDAKEGLDTEVTENGDWLKSISLSSSTSFSPCIPDSNSVHSSSIGNDSVEDCVRD